MAYIKYNPTDMNTGQLAKAYQKLEQNLRKRAGNCWEYGSSSKRAREQVLQFDTKRLDDGTREVHAVKMIDIIRFRQDFTIDSPTGYTQTCGNPYCLNPAHQVPYEATTDDEMEWARDMRMHGWATIFLQRIGERGRVYRQIRDEEINAGTGRQEAAYDVNQRITMTDVYAMAKLIADAHPRVPEYKELAETAGLSDVELLPYGFAVAAMLRRAGTGSEMLDMVDGFVNGKTNEQIAKLLGVALIKVQTFRGALYG